MDSSPMNLLLTSVLHLALALMKRDEGEVEAVHALLQEARRNDEAEPTDGGTCRLHRPIGGEMGVKRSPSAPNKTDYSYA